MSALDPVAFLRTTPPFSDLPPALFTMAARALETSFFAAGTRLVLIGGTPLQHVYVIRKGAVRLERAGSTLQILEEGEVFGYTSLFAGEATLDVTVEEDLLAHRIPAADFERLLADARFASHFAVSLAERLAHSLARPRAAALPVDLGSPVEGLLHQPPVRVPAGATVGDAARAMREHRVSSVLVDTSPPGIVTDRDFRNRVLAEDLGPATPIAAVASSPLRTVPGGMAVYEAWQTLLEQKVHHLPVTRGGTIVGVLTDSDLLRTSAQGPPAMLRTVERLAARDELPGYAGRVGDMARELLSGGLDATVIGGFVARLNDALLARILRWAEADLGAPPAPYAWIALGSEGRMEQTLLTDQDNALVHGGSGADQDYFARLAERANLDLEAAGFPRCAGGYMARTWHDPLPEWEDRFLGWLADPNPQALLHAAIFFDYRKVHGALDLAPLDAVLAQAAKARVFLSCLAKSALDFRPPSSLLLRLGGEVDLKAQAVAPIVFLARAYALEAGSPARNTLERLEAAMATGIIGGDVRATICEAYRFFLGLRLREQIRKAKAGEPTLHAVRLADLTSVERSRLKDSLRAVREWQERAAYHFRTELF